MKRKRHGYTYMKTPDMYFEVWGFPRISDMELVPASVRHIRTLVLYGGKWVSDPFSSTGSL